MTQFNRRHALGLLAGTAIASMIPAALAATGKTHITVHKTPWCGCCTKWSAHLRDAGFEVSEIKHDDLTPIKQQYGVPPMMESCHTAVVDGYAIEGHVPADDIKRLLEKKPDALGLAVPGMPTGSPGMEMGDSHDAYDVLLFKQDGYSVFRHYREI